MDVVPQAGAIRGVVAAAEDHQLLAASHRDLSDEGHQVVRDALGVFTDAAGRVRPHRAEVAQQGDVPTAVRGIQVRKNILDLLLGAPSSILLSLTLVGRSRHEHSPEMGQCAALERTAGIPPLPRIVTTAPAFRYHAGWNIAVHTGLVAARTEPRY
jgi:hypothetical protein